MKLVRILLVCVSVVVVLALIAGALALTPSVQTWAVRRALAGQPGLDVEIGRVAAGLNRVELTNVRFRQPGLDFTAPSAVVEMSLLGALRNDLHVRRLVAKGWTAEIFPAEAPAASSPPAPKSQPKPGFDGVFNLLRLPVDLAVDHAEIEGTLNHRVVRDRPGSKVQIALNGGGLGAGKEGRFTLAVDVSIPAAEAPVSDLTLRSTVLARMTSPRSIERVAISADATAMGPQVPSGAKLHADVVAAREGSAENYAISLKRLGDSAEKDLLSLKAMLPANTAVLAGEWRLNVRDSDIAPFALGLAIPTFEASGNGSFHTDRAFLEVRVAGKVEATGERFEVVKSELGVLGKLGVRASFDLTNRANTLRVTELSADVAGQKPVASVKVLQAIEINTSTAELKVADPAAELLRIALQGVPLAWARPFSGDLEVKGGDVSGDFVARAHDGGFTLRATGPLTIGGLEVSNAGQPLATGLDLTVKASADYTPAGWQANVSEFSARQGRMIVASFSGRAGKATGDRQPTKVAGLLWIDLVALGAQPVAKGMPAFSTGKLETELTASLAPMGMVQVAATLTATDLVTGTKQALPAISGNLRADVHPEGRIELQAPLIFERGGRKSDLELTANIVSGKSASRMELQVTSNELFVEDMQVFSALGGGGAATEKPTAPTPSKTPAPQDTPDERPMWGDITGTLKLALKKIVYSPDVQAGNVNGSFKIEAAAIWIETLRAIFGEGSEVDVAGSVKFEKHPSDPYLVQGKLTATNFDPGPVLRAANPGRTPTVEGKFDIAGNFEGRAPSLDRVAERVRAKLKLTSREGRFHGFEAALQAANLGRLQQTLSQTSNSPLGSLIGGVLSVVGKDALPPEAQKALAAATALGRLMNLSFDQLTVEVEHKPGEATQIQNFSLISPDVRLVASGSLAGKTGLRWLDWPLRLDTQMAVRGAQADDLRTAGLLKREADPLGYTPLVENFVVEGTLSNMAMGALIKLALPMFR